MLNLTLSRRQYYAVKIYALASTLILSGFMAWFFYTLGFKGSVWLVTPDQWNQAEFILSALSVGGVIFLIIDFIGEVREDRLGPKTYPIKDVLIPDFFVQAKMETQVLRNFAEEYGFHIFEADNRLILFDFARHISWWSENKG